MEAIAFHPILFYDFIMHNGVSPLETKNSYRKSQGCGIPRPIFLHCIDDRLCLFNPSNDEASGIRALGYILILFSLSKVLKDSKPFGKSHHSYSTLLVPTLTGEPLVGQIDVKDLLDYA